MEISVVIITFNEEHNLARCIASVKQVADDIVVVDSFSTDATEKIARENGARFHPGSEAHWTFRRWLQPGEADELLRHLGAARRLVP